jgi:hypothetical protein
VSGQFFDYNPQSFNGFLNATQEKLNILENLALIEIARGISIEVSYDIESFFYFKELKKRYRISKLELNEFEDEISRKNSKDQVENLNLKLKNIIVDLQNIGRELSKEKKNRRNSLVSKAAVWAIPVLIGIYQLLAMNYLYLNPKSPFILYATALVLIYFFIKINNPRYYLKYVITEINSARNFLGVFLIIGGVIALSDYPYIELELGFAYSVFLTLFMLLSISLISFKNAKIKYLKDNKELIREFITKKMTDKE